MSGGVRDLIAYDHLNVREVHLPRQGAPSLSRTLCGFITDQVPYPPKPFDRVNCVHCYALFKTVKQFKRYVFDPVLRATP